ncbi:G-type lectin S-receptor-like serine/threonine-protein kinase At4g27290 [Hevea brasiliensis]|uniref:G-type lectin S-receptor-like serine/threonine-protein kinase At4g27290 n=1 Tax=Hevea brasiliensis TaxID=3981 RepID=UPI0025DBCF37|nr:G-type lectin S-receptor-like serine/threonine-protein kinase At4g27290 [Hevea brasiliensis]
MDPSTKINMGCLSDGYKRVKDLLNDVQKNRTDCPSFYSSIVVKQSPPVINMIKLAWWLNGTCKCSENANCIFLSLPHGKTGYQCHCNKGFRGDGFRESLPCQRSDDDDIKHFTKILAMSVVLAGVLLLILSLLLLSYLRTKMGIFGNNHMNVKNNDSSHSQEEDLELPLFDLATITSATNGFSANNKIGEGGFGPVYKGILEGGQEIAVKRLSKSSRRGLKEFKNEVILIAKLQHRNLVKLLGCCIEGDEKMLIYEYMPNKSLDSLIFDPRNTELLDWPNIINVIVSELIYLHQGSRLRIIRRNLKANSILINYELNLKISYFGMARSFGGNEIEKNTNKVVGTFGYISPDYMLDGIYSIKSDVFNFDVFILEIISGKRNRGFRQKHYSHGLNILGYAWMLYVEGRYWEPIDGSTGDSCSPSEAVRLIQVGLLRVQQNPEDIPSMSDVVLMLGGEGTLPQSKKPGFYIKRVLLDFKSSSSSNKMYSVNKGIMTPLQNSVDATSFNVLCYEYVKYLIKALQKQHFS